MNLVDELRKLSELHQNGSLSDDEFSQAKACLFAAEAPAESSQLEDHLAESRCQTELARIDREWDLEREQYYLRGKHGHRYLPSKGIGIATAAIGGVFGLIWTIAAFSMTSNSQHTSVFVSVFPMFGLGFIAVAIGFGVYTIVRAQALEQATSRYRVRRQNAATELLKFRPNDQHD